jgi:hypothetical protein
MSGVAGQLLAFQERTSMELVGNRVKKVEYEYVSILATNHIAKGVQSTPYMSLNLKSASDNEQCIT